MNIQEFCNTATSFGVAKSPSNLQQYLDVLFRDIDFTGRSFLDIGGGTGLFTHYAAWRGASRAVCLEPEDDGSTSGASVEFANLASALNVSDRVALDNRLFQDYTDEQFDIVLLHNSINHLDEPACVDLLVSDEARKTFIDLFIKLHSMVADDGDLIACDCGRRNFFGDLGIKNPVMPTIEWEKHQEPKVWAELLEEAGFETKRISWNTFNSLGRFGPALFGYFIPSYFTLSHFRLQMKKAATRQ